MKKVIVGFGASLTIVAGAALAVGNVAFAELPAVPVSSCTNLSYDLKTGSSDAGQQNVYKLQQFLNTRGYLASKPTGYFGSLTTQAVRKFQIENTVNATGYVGPVTRAKIQAQTCGNTTVNVSNPTPTTPTSQCTNGALFNTVTGARCTTDPLQASLELARIKEADTKIKSAISSLRAGAEITYSSNNPNSYNGVCIGGVVNGSNPYLPGIGDLLNYTYNASKCVSSAQKYAVSVILSTGESWCVDNTGMVGAGTIDSTTLNCRTNQAPIQTQPTGSPKVTLISPNGGENWNLDQMMVDRFIGTAVNWNLQNVTGRVDMDVYLLKGTIAVASFGTFNLDKNGPQSSSVLLQPTTLITSGNDYRMRLVLKSPSGVVLSSDDSDNYFTIGSQANQPSVTIITPNGGETWDSESPYNKVSVKVSNTTDTRVLTLNATNIMTGKDYLLTTGISVQSGVRDITFSPQALELPEGTYKVKATVTQYPYVGGSPLYDESDSAFTIKHSTTLPYISVLNPSPGESLTTGSTYTIKWNSNGVSQVAISIGRIGQTLPKPDGLYITPTGLSDTRYLITNTNQFFWTVPRVFATDNNYMIEIDDVAGRAIGQSKAFTIVAGQ